MGPAKEDENSQTCQTLDQLGLYAENSLWPLCVEVGQKHTKACIYIQLLSLLTWDMNSSNFSEDSQTIERGLTSNERITKLIWME